MAAKQEGSTTLFEAQLVPLPSVLQQRQFFSFPTFTSSLQPEALPALLVDVEDPGLDLGHYLLEVVPQAIGAVPGMTDLQYTCSLCTSSLNTNIMHHIHLIDVNIIAGVVLGVYKCLVHTHAITL